ncbi:hypothetical protein O181_127486 [Austropuccinia psidii MF-1]|uniref:Uncharacterized protein n=1 Tax=Austropuccinia psidii MF-1 TaxID=1389203 RepID=A0A9Q3KX44_9BASI|nr:hypothetical protein [Austropuccinia psidii MF-1]
MAFWGHLGPLQRVGRDSRSTAKRGQRGKPPSPQGQVGPKPHSDPPEPKLVTNPLDPKLAKDLLDTILAINPVGPIFGHGPIFQPWPLATTRGHQISSVSLPSSQLMGSSFHSFIPSILKVAGMVHVWYYIPLCTIFAQQSNGDVFKTHFHLSILRSQNPTPILKEDYSSHQSDKLWQKLEDSSRIPTNCICRSWVGTLFRIIQSTNSQEVLNQCNQLSRNQVF